MTNTKTQNMLKLTDLVFQSSGHYVSVLCLVLRDPQARAVYDIFGKKGLEVEGWEVRPENHRN